MSDRTCITARCNEPVHASNLCHRHYDMQRRHGFLSAPPTEREPLVCVCPVPDPDAIGQCLHCARKVVTYVAEPLHTAYYERWPAEWQRALDLGLWPRPGNYWSTAFHAPTYDPHYVDEVTDDTRCKLCGTRTDRLIHDPTYRRRYGDNYLSVGA